MLVHRFGGWYSDLDMIFLRPFQNTKGGQPLQNVAASDDVHFFNYDKPDQKYNWGKDISNAIFHNEAGHIFLETAIKVFNTTFVNGQWASSGPVVLTKALQEICGQKYTWTTPMNPMDYSRGHCSGFAVVEPRLFYPFDWFNAAELSTSKLNSFWDDNLKKSYVVHFYGSSSQKTIEGKKMENRGGILARKYYGKLAPALAYIAPKECPVSFFSQKPF